MRTRRRLFWTPLQSFSLTIGLSSLLFIGCDGRPLTLGESAAAEGGVADTGADAGSPAEPDRCVIAVRQQECCWSYEAVSVELVKRDPCCSSVEVPDDPGGDCPLLIMPCTEECSERPPSLAVARDAKGACIFVSDCAKDQDCEPGEVCRPAARAPALLSCQPELDTAGTPCGTQLCDPVGEVCVIHLGWSEQGEASCLSVPAACGADHSCACVADMACGDYVEEACFDQPAPNTISCECLNC